jgi:hypothetical protein
LFLSKLLRQHYPPLVVTAWSFNIAAVFMGVTALFVLSSKSTMEWICPDCGDNVWTIPSGTFFALGYFILFTSVAGYGLMTWANNQHATGTLIMGYTVLQPATAALLTLVLLASPSFLQVYCYYYYDCIFFLLGSSGAGIRPGHGPLYHFSL